MQEEGKDVKNIYNASCKNKWLNSGIFPETKAVTAGFEESSRIICSLAETVQQTKASFETISAKRV